jgi:Flp pilus assembly protein TadG
MFLKLRAAGSGERGATSVIVVVLLVPVLLGATALSVDLGQLMWERRQLQNGADAAVMAAANTCAKTPASCPTTTTTALTTLAGDNANDGTTTVQSICGSAAAKAIKPALTLCPTTPLGVTNCPPVPTALAALPYVELRTITRNTNGTDTITSKFASVASGTARQTTVGACARAVWGAPGGGPGTLPITISGCDWMRATGGTPGGGGGSYYPAPVYNGATTPDRGYGGAGRPGWPAAPATPPAYNVGQEVILMLQGTGSGTPACPAPPGSGAWAGHALPAGFGNVKTVSGQPCQADIKAYHWVQSDTGNNTSCDLSAYVGMVVQVPIFDCTDDAQPNQEPPISTCADGNGSNAWYHLKGYASFYLSGYFFNVAGGIPNKVKSVNPNFNAFPCNSGERCISGWFTTATVSATTVVAPPGGAGSFGTIAVVPAG